MLLNNFKKRYLAVVLPALWLSACNSGGTTPSSTSTGCNPCSVFVTTKEYDGNLLQAAIESGFTGKSIGNNGESTGVYAADYLCNHDESTPKAGYFKAFLVDGVNRVACSTPNCAGAGNTSTDWVLHPNTSYIWARNESFAWQTNQNSLFESTTLMPLRAFSHHSGYWTGFESQNWIAPEVNTSGTCQRFTNSNSASIGYVGWISGTSPKHAKTFNNLTVIHSTTNGSGKSTCGAQNGTFIMCVQQ